MEANKSRIDHVDNMKDLLVGLATITQNNQSTGIHWITDCVYNREAGQWYILFVIKFLLY